MYNFLKSVIKNGNYKLSDIQYKAKKLYVNGDITEKQFDEIIGLASYHVNSNAERPEVLDMLKGLSERIEALEKHVFADDNTAPDTESGEEEVTEKEYEAWQPWDGISDKYQIDAIVTHGDKLWISKFNGQNVWEPGTAGTESMWAEYTPATEQTDEQPEQTEQPDEQSTEQPDEQSTEQPTDQPDEQPDEQQTENQ